MLLLGGAVLLFGGVVLIVRQPFYGLLLFLCLRHLVPVGLVSEYDTFQQLLLGFPLWISLTAVLMEKFTFRTERARAYVVTPPSFRWTAFLFAFSIFVSSIAIIFDFENFFNFRVMSELGHVNRATYAIVLNAFLFSLLIFWLTDTRIKLKQLFYCFVFIGVVLAIGGFLQYAGVIQLNPEIQPESEMGRLTTYTGISATATGERLMIIGVITMLLVPGATGTEFGLLFAAASITLFAMILSFTRIAFIAFAGSLSLFLLFNLKRARVVFGVLPVLASIAWAAQYLGIVELARGSARLSDSRFYYATVYDLRVPRWLVAFEVFKQKWLVGHGLGSSKEIVGSQLPAGMAHLYGSLHNAYVSWIVDTGVIGLVALLALYLVTLRNLHVARRVAVALRDPQLLGFSNALWCAFLGGSLLYMSESDPVFDIFFGFFFALSFVLRKLVCDEQRTLVAAEGYSGDAGLVARRATHHPVGTIARPVGIERNSSGTLARVPYRATVLSSFPRRVSAFRRVRL